MPTKNPNINPPVTPEDAAKESQLPEITQPQGPPGESSLQEPLEFQEGFTPGESGLVEQPEAAEGSFIDFGLAALSNIHVSDIDVFSQQHNIPARLRSKEYYREQFPNLGHADFETVYNDLVNMYQLYEANNIDHSHSVLQGAGIPRKNIMFDNAGLPTRDLPTQEFIKLPPDHMYGPGYDYEPLRMLSPQQQAEHVGFFFDKNNQLVENSRKNRLGRMLVLRENPDPESAIPYFWQESSWTDAEFTSSIRTFMGPQRVQSSTIGSLFNLRGSTSGFMGMSVSALGGWLSAVSDLGEDVVNAISTSREAGHHNPDRIANKMGNRLTNLGAYITHMNEDEQMGPFTSWSSFSYGVYSGIGQLMSMAMLAKAARNFGATPRMSGRISLGLGGSQAAASFRSMILEMGGSEADAAKFFFLFGAGTYTANMFIASNLAQVMLARQGHQIMKKELNAVGRFVQKMLPKKLSEASSQTKTKLANKTAQGLVAKIRKGRDYLGDRLTKLSERGPLGTAFAMSFEESLEEVGEEFLHAPIEAFYNRSFALPGARETVEYHKLHDFEYAIHRDENGLPTYWRYDRDGNREELDYRTWDQEQKDLQMAEGVLRGEMPFDVGISFDEAGIAAISSFISGIGMHYGSGAHKVRRDNDGKMLREQIAIHLSQKKAGARERALKEIENQLREEQKKSNLFGPNYIREDGTVIAAGEQTQADVSVADRAIQLWMDDLRLNLHAIDYYGLQSPEATQAIRHNNYLLTEGLEVVKHIEAVSARLDQAQKGEKVEAYEQMVKEGDTAENIEQTLQGLQRAFDHIFVPQDPSNPKSTSRRYSEIFLEQALVDHKIHSQARKLAAVQMQQENPGQAVDRNSPEFKSAYRKHLAQIKKNEGHIAALAWAQNPSKFYDLLNVMPQGTTAYSVLDNIFNNLVSQEVTSLVNEMNQRIEQSREQFQNAPETLAHVKSDIEALQLPSLEQISQDISGRQEVPVGTHDQLSDFSDTVERTFETLNTLASLSRHNVVSTRMKGDIMKAYRSFAQKITPFVEQVSDLQNDIMGNYPGELLTIASNISESINALNRVDEGLARTERTEVVENFEAESPEFQQQLRREAFENFIQGTHRTGLVEGVGPREVPFIEELRSFENFIGQDGTEVSDPGQKVREIQNIKDVAETFTDLIEINHEFLQNLSGDEAQHSVLRNENRGKTELTESDAAYLQEGIDEIVNLADRILKHEKLNKHSRTISQVKEHVNDLSVRNFMLGEIFDFFSEEGNRSKMPKEFAQAYDQVGHLLGESEKNEFYHLFERFISEKENQPKVKKEVLERIGQIEKAIIDAENSLGGQLESFIVQHKEWAENFAVQNKNTLHQVQFNVLHDFIGGHAFTRTGKEFKGFYSVPTFENAISPSSREFQTKLYTTLSYANMLNKFGRTRENGETNFTLKEVHQAFRDVLKQRSVDYNVTTQAQWRAVQHVVGFILDSDSSLLHRSEILSDIIKNSIYLRGVAGSGKSTQVIVDVLETIAQMTGESPKVTYVVPTPGLLETHKRNQAIVDPSLENSNIVYLHEFLNNKVSVRDIVIFDEIGLISQSKYSAKINEKLDGRTAIFLGDDSQVSEFNSVSQDVPMKTVIMDRTIPLTEVFRSGNPQHFSLQDYYRAFSVGNVGTKMPHLNYEYNEAGSISGGRYYSNTAELVEGFMSVFERLSPNQRVPSELLYIVPSLEQRQGFLTKLEETHGKKVADEGGPLVKTIQYEPTLEAYQHAVSGISSRKVFFEYNPTDFLRSYITSSAIGGLPTLYDVSPGVLNTLGRVGLTGATRQIEFIGLIGDPANSSQGRVLITDSEVSDQTKGELTQAMVDRLDLLADKETTYTKQTKKEGEQETPTKKSKSDFPRNLPLTEGSRLAIKEGKTFKKVTSILKTENKNAVDKLQEVQVDDGTDAQGLKQGVYHATDLAFDQYKQKHKVTDETYTPRQREEQIKSRMVRSILMHVTDGSDTFRQQAVEIVNELNDLYRSDDTFSESAIIKHPEKYVQSLLRNLQESLVTLAATDLSIIDPTILAKDIEITGRDGNLYRSNVQANPAMISVVGIDRQGNPIVDIYDFVIHHSRETLSDEIGPYSVQKYGMYGAVASAQEVLVDGKKKNLKVNRVVLTNYFMHKDAIQTLPTTFVTESQLTEGIASANEIVNVFQKKDPNLEALVEKPDFFANERVMLDDAVKEGFAYHTGTGRFGQPVVVDNVISVTSKNNKVTKYVNFTDHVGKPGRLSYSEFNKRYMPISDAKEHLNENRFYKRADVFESSELKPTMSHTLYLTGDDVSQNINTVLKSPAYRARNTKVIGEARNRQYPVEKRYLESYDGVRVNEDGSIAPQSFEHVVVNQIVDSYINDNIDWVRETLQEAGLVQDGQSLSKAKAIEMFKKHNFHILGMDNTPEFNFSNDNSLTKHPVIKTFLNAPVGSKQEIDAFRQAKKIIEEGFPKMLAENVPDPHYDKIVAYNIHKLVQLKEVIDAQNEGTPITASVVEMTLGNLIMSDSPTLYSDFVNEMTKRGFHHGEIKMVKDPKIGRTYFQSDFYMDGIPGTVPVQFNAVPANANHVRELLTDLNKVAKSQELNSLFEEIDVLVTKEDFSETDRQVLKDVAIKAKDLIRITNAYQFIAANRSQLAKIRDQIQENLSRREMRTEDADQDVLGMVFEVSENRVDIAGYRAKDRLNNLYSALSALADLMTNDNRQLFKNVKLYQNPWLYVESQVQQESGKTIPNPDKIETLVKEIKQPELYISPSEDQLIEIENRIAQLQGINTRTGDPRGNDSNSAVGGLFKRNIDNRRVQPHDLISRQEAVNELSGLLPAFAVKHKVKLHDDVIQVKNNELFGRLFNDMLEFSGFPVNNEIMVERRTPRHEAMHFIMQHMLDTKTFNRVVQDIKNELGENWDGSMTHVFEYAAENFEIKANVPRPRNIFERAIQFVKEVANRWGLYALSYREMLMATDRGFYIDGHMRGSPNAEIDMLAKNKFTNRYKTPEAVARVVRKFDDYSTYARVRDTFVAPALKHYLPYGKSTKKYVGGLAAATYKAHSKFLEPNNYRIHSEQDLLGEKIVFIRGERKRVREMTPQDFVVAKSQMSDRHFQAVDFYVQHVLSNPETMNVFLQDLLPNTQILHLVEAGKQETLRERGIIGTKASNNAAETTAHMDGFNKSQDHRIPDALNILISTVPMYKRVSGDRYNRTNFLLPISQVKKIMVDNVERMREAGTYENMTPDTFFRALREHLESGYVFGKMRDSIASVLMEFGDMANYRRSKARGEYLESNQGVIQDAGYLHIINNPDRVSTAAGIQGQKHSFANRVSDLHTALSGILSHFKSTEVKRTVLAVGDRGKNNEVRSNNTALIQRQNIVNNIETNLFADDGSIDSMYGEMMNPNSNSYSIKVNSEGLFVRDTQRKDGPWTEVYNRKAKRVNFADEHSFQLVLSGLGIRNFPMKALRNVAATQKRQQSHDFANALYMMTAAAKVNYDLSKAFFSKLDQVQKAIDAGKEVAFDPELQETMFNEMPSETKQLFKDVLETPYRRSHSMGTVITSENVTTPGGIPFQISAPSPIDFTQEIDMFAQIITDANAIEAPSFSYNAEGGRIHSHSPHSTLTTLLHGSEPIVDSYRSKATRGLDNSPLAASQVEGGHRFNNSILKRTLGFDAPSYVVGSRAGNKGKNFDSLTTKDMYIAMVENLFAADMKGRMRGFHKYNVVLTPNADKKAVLSVPFYFYNPRERNTIPLFTKPKRDGVRVLEINQTPIVDTFSDIVNYYQARNRNTINKVSDVFSLIGKKKELNTLLESPDATVTLVGNDATTVRQMLVNNRDYILQDESFNSKGERVITIAPGHGLAMDNTPFNQEFFGRWVEAQTTAQKYQLLREVASEEFVHFISDMVESGAFHHIAQNRDGKLDFEVANTFTQEIANVSTLRSKEIRNIRDEWFKTWLADNKAFRNKYPDITTLEQLNKLGRGHEAITQVYREMYKPETGVRQAITNAKKHFTKKTKKVIAQEGKRYEEMASAYGAHEFQWPSYLEGVFMMHWAANESLGQLLRSDITSYAGISDYIKRGSMLSAPGTSFDFSNPFGAGPNMNVIVMNDLGHYNEFFGVPKGDRAGRRLITDGHSTANPVWQMLLQRNAGKDLGLIGDYATKTVVSGHDISNDQPIYFKFSQHPITADQFNNNAFYRDAMKAFLGKHYSTFKQFLSESNNNFDVAVQRMADWVVDPANAIDGVLPRDEMGSYVVYASSFKAGLTAVNDFLYNTKDPAEMNVETAYFPQSLTTLKVPSDFIRLQNVNNSLGDADTHSFPTQLYSLMGVKAHNLDYSNRFTNALNDIANQFSTDINAFLSDPGNLRDRERLRSFVTSKVAEISGDSIRGSKFEELLLNPNIDPSVLRTKLSDTFASYLNNHLKPRVPGDNRVQQPYIGYVYEGEAGVISLASDLGLESDRQLSKGNVRRMLKPITYMTSDGVEFTSKVDLQNHIAQQGPEGVRVSPQEMIMKFPYHREFGLAPNASLAQVMALTNNFSLYESGMVRALGRGARDASHQADIILNASEAQTVGGLISMFQSADVVNRFGGEVRQMAIRELEANEAFSALQRGNQERNQMIQERTDAILAQPLGTAEGQRHQILNSIGEYYYNLNNALDVVSVRIPTTNASSAAHGRIVAFTDSGNSVYTSSVKNILDGSDYDHDELHVFYPDLENTRRTESPENQMFDAVWDFYSDSRNYDLVTDPINLQTFRVHAETSDIVAAENRIQQEIPNSIYSNVKNFNIGYAGLALTGMFANQMQFTNKLMSTPQDVRNKMFNPSLAMLFNENTHPQTVSLIAKFVNAAVDNQNEGGLLGRLGIDETVTPVIAGMVLMNTPVVQMTEAGEVSQSVEQMILNELQGETLRAASRAVLESNSVTNQSRSLRIHEQLAQMAEQGDLKAQELLQYAYAGEQMLRIGNIFKLIQEIPGTQYKGNLAVHNIEVALGQKLSSFLTDQNLNRVRDIDFSNQDSQQVTEFIENQIETLAEHLYDAKQMERSRVHEQEIRSMINVPGLVANSPFMLSQLRALDSFIRAKQELFPSSRHQDIRAAVLDAVGRKEFLYEDAFNEYNNAFDHLLVGGYFTDHGPNISLTYASDYVNTRRLPSSLDYSVIPTKTENNIITRSYNLKKPSHVMEFVYDMPDFVQTLKKLYPDNAFLERLDLEPMYTAPISVINFRNSIYISPAEKAQYKNFFQELAQQNPAAAGALRAYQALVYGFSFRNGSMFEVMDSVFEHQFSDAINDIESRLVSRFEDNPSQLIEEIAVMAPSIITPVSSLSQKTEVPSIYKYIPYGSRTETIFSKRKDSPGTRDRKEVNITGHTMINAIYPRNLFIYGPAEVLTTDFVYEGFSQSQLNDLRTTGSTSRFQSRWAGIRKNRAVDQTTGETDLARLNRHPVDGSFVRTVLNQLTKVEYVNDNQFRAQMVRNKDNPPESRMRNLSSRISERAIEALVEKVGESFRGLPVEFVTNDTSMTNGNAYFHDGRVYINTDKVQADTFFHEISHPLLDILERVRPGQYEMLYNDAQAMVMADDGIVQLVRKSYPELYGESFVKEVMATVIGMHSAPAVSEWVALRKYDNHAAEATRIWNRIENISTRAWDSIKALFGSKYDINIDPGATTLQSFSQDVVNKAMAGENVLSLTSAGMKDFIKAGWDNVVESRAIVNDTRSMRELFVNNPEFIKEGQRMEIVPERHFTRQQRVQEIKRQTEYGQFRHIGEDGTVYDFSKIPESKWDSVIEGQLLDKRDPFALKKKDKLLKALNAAPSTPSELQGLLGKSQYGDFVYSEGAVNRLFKQMKVRPNVRYYQYSQLPGTDFAHLYNDQFVGFDPIIAIEYNTDDMMMISIYNLTNESLYQSDLGSSPDRVSILSKYMSDAKAKRLGIRDFTNKTGDVSNFLNSLIASDIVNSSNKKVSVRDVGTIRFNANSSEMALTDAVHLVDTAKKMLEVQQFIDDISPAMKQAIERMTFMSEGFSLESYLRNMYEDQGIQTDGMSLFVKGTADTNTKRNVLAQRLRDILSREGEGLSNAQMVEIDLILREMNNLRGVMMLSEQLNSRKDIDTFETFISPQFDVGHEFIDTVRRTVLETSQRNVAEMKNFKEMLNPFASFFESRFGDQKGVLTNEYARDINYMYYEPLLAKVKDQDGKERFAGSILWTTDKNLDPLFYRQAQEVDPEVLKWGKFVVDTVTDIMIDNVIHKRNMDGVYFVKEDGQKVPYGRKQAEKELFEKSTYRRGMLPLMPDRVGNLLSKGKFKDAANLKKKQIMSRYVMFEDSQYLSDNENFALDGMPDEFFAQFGFGALSTDVGRLGLKRKRMQQLLGLFEDADGNYLYSDKSRKVQSLNTDLEILLEFIKITSLRKRNYESNVLPVLNAARVYMLDLDRGMNFSQKRALEYLDLFQKQAIEGKRKRLVKDMGGVNVDAFLQTSMAYASPLVMAGNVNVGIVSGVHNFMMSFIEGVANQLADRHWFGFNHVMDASQAYISDNAKVTQLSHMHQIINPNEYEIVTHRYNQKRRKHVFSDYYAQWTNWATDAYARSVIMVAQMKKDGSYAAYDYDSDSGKVFYNPRKDRKFFNEDGSQTKEQKALYDSLKQRLVQDGIPLTKDGDATRGYSLMESRTFKTLADKYVVGAYGNMEKNMLANYTLGRMGMMFTTWFMTKISNAWKRGTYLDELGYIDIKYDDAGNPIPFWQREWTEGYMNTVLNIGKKLFLEGDIKQFSNLKPHEKYNLIKFSMTMATFLSTFIMYGLFVRGGMFGDDEDKPIPEWRMIRNVSYAGSSLFTLPIIADKLDSPFAVSGIMRRAFIQGIGSAGWQNLRYVVPLYGGGLTLAEPFMGE